MGEERELKNIYYYTEEENMNKLVDEMVEDMDNKVLLRDKPFTEYEKKQILDKMVKDISKKIFDMNSRIGNLYKNCKEVQKYLREQKRKELKLISKKRFKKLLYSVGYGRKAAEEIADLEWKYKGWYDMDDYKYWRDIIEKEKNK